KERELTSIGGRPRPEKTSEALIYAKNKLDSIESELRHVVNELSSRRELIKVYKDYVSNPNSIPVGFAQIEEQFQNDRGLQPFEDKLKKIEEQKAYVNRNVLDPLRSQLLYSLDQDRLAERRAIEDYKSLRKPELEKIARSKEQQDYSIKMR